MLHQTIRIMLLSLLVIDAAVAADKDPLNSVMWDFLLKNELRLEADQVRFDERVEVYAPASVEDGMNVPVSVRVNGMSLKKRKPLFHPTVPG